MQAKALIKNPYLWGALIGILSLHLFRELSYFRRHAPAPLSEFSSWSMENLAGGHTASKGFLGSIVIANMLAHGDPSNPKMMNAQVEIAKRFQGKENVRFVTFLLGNQVQAKGISEAFSWPSGLPEHVFLITDANAFKQVILDQMKMKAQYTKTLPQLMFIDRRGDLRALSDVTPLDLASLVSAINFLLE